MTHAELIAALRAASIVKTEVGGVSLRLRPMTGSEYVAFSEAASALKRGEGKPITDCELLAAHLVDEADAPISTNPDDFDAWPVPMRTAAVRKLLKLSGFKIEDEPGDSPAKN